MFRKFWSRMKKDQSGFTLVELLVVVVIIGVLTAIAIPIFQNVTTTANEGVRDANARVLRGAAAMYMAEQGVPESAITITSSTGELDQYIEAWPRNPVSDADFVSVVIGSDGSITVNP